MRKTLMLYYSLEGNTGYVAECARQVPGIEVEQLRVAKEPPKRGPGKFLQGGRSALLGEDPGLMPLRADLSDYDTIILAFPVWAGTFPPAIGALLRQYSLAGKRVYVIACSASGKGDKAVERVRKALPDQSVAGALNLIDPLKRREETQARLGAFIQAMEEN